MRFVNETVELRGLIVIYDEARSCNESIKATVNRHGLRRRDGILDAILGVARRLLETALVFLQLPWTPPLSVQSRTSERDTVANLARPETRSHRK